MHDDFVTRLSDYGTDTPEILVSSVGEELSLDVEGAVGIDQGAVGAIGAFSIVSFSLIAHIIIALTDSVACAIVAGMGRHVEAVWVGLHHVDGLALGVVRGQSVLSTILLIKLDHVDTCNTTALNRAEVDFKLEGATSEVRGEDGIRAVPSAVLDDHGVVVRDVESVVAFISCNRGPVLRAEVLGLE